MQICPYLEASFQILGKRWNGLIIHYLSICPNNSAHFSDMKKDITDITPRALSMKLTELTELGLVNKRVIEGSSVTITYELTEVGQQLSEALKPVQAWAKNNIKLDQLTNKKSEGNL